MNSPLKQNYLEKIRYASIHRTLRLVIDLIAGLAFLASVGATVPLFATGHRWLAICNLASIVLIYAIRRLAILVVDIADMLVEQGTKVEGGKVDA